MLVGPQPPQPLAPAIGDGECAMQRRQSHPTEPLGASSRFKKVVLPRPKYLHIVLLTISGDPTTLLQARASSSSHSGDPPTPP